MPFFRYKSLVFTLAAYVGIVLFYPSVSAQEANIKIKEFGVGFLVTLGGKLYDNLWVVIDAEPPKGRNPKFPKGVSIAEKDTWRCVSCHGWDYSGDKGERAELGLNVAFRSLKKLGGTDPELIVAKIRNAHRDYPASAFPEFITEMLAIFISAGQFDRDALFDDLGRVTGDFDRGRDIFEGTCMNCHEPDGRGKLTGEAGDRSSLGWLARNRPEQALHKIRNGVPGAEMLALGFLEDHQIRNLMTYLQALDPNEN